MGIVHLATAMGMVLASWLVLSALYLGAGSLLVRCLQGKPFASQDPLACGASAPTGPRESVVPSLHLQLWLGVALVIAMLQLWHLLLPVRGAAILLLVVPGLIGLALHGRQLGLALRGLIRDHPLVTALVVACCVLIANRAIGAPLNIDSGLYHFGSVRWLVEHPIITGLGNVHDRFAFNNAGLLLNALLEGSLWAGRSHHFQNSLLVVWLLCKAAYSLAAFIRHGVEGPRSALSILPAFFLVPVFGIVFSSNISSPSTDPPAALASIAVILALGELLIPARRDSLGASHERDRILAASVVILSALAVSFKVSQVFLAIPASLLAAWVYVQADEHPWSKRVLLARTAWLTLIFVVVFGSVWVARSIMQSGYPAYPSSIMRANVDWAVPSFQAAACEGYVKADSRMMRDVTAAKLTDFSWLGRWLRWQLRSINLGITVLPTLLALGLGVLALLRWRTASLGRAYGLAMVLGIGLAGWFLTTPMPRFGIHLTWGLAAFAGAMAITAWRAHMTRPVRIAIALMCLGVGLLPAAGAVAMSLRGGPGSTRNAILIKPGSDHGFHPTPVATLAEFRSSSGVVELAPALGFQTWDGPLISTPYPSRDVVWRKPGDIRGGFRSQPATPAPAPATAITAAAEWLRGKATTADHFYFDDDAFARLTDFRGAGLPDVPMLGDPSRVRDPKAYTHEMSTLEGQGRVWLIFADGTQGMVEDELGMCVYVLDPLGLRVETKDFGGVTVMLYDMAPR